MASSANTCRLALRLLAGVYFLSALLAAGKTAQAAGVGQESPDRPPWAQKPKKAEASKAGAPVEPTDDSDPAQDRAKIKVKVDLVNVLVSVLDEHNRPAPDLPLQAFQLLDEDNPQTIAVFE